MPHLVCITPCPLRIFGLCLLLAAAGFAAAAAEETEPGQTKDLGWAQLSYPGQVAPGEAFELVVTVAADAITSDAKLVAGFHPFINNQRKPTGSNNRPPQRVAAGVESEHRFRFTVPTSDGLQALAVQFWLSPSGGWSDKVHNGEVGIQVRAAE